MEAGVGVMRLRKTCRIAISSDVFYREITQCDSRPA